MLEMAMEPSIIKDGFRFTESPHWHEGLLWFSDMHSDKVFAVDDAGAVRTEIDVPGGPNGLGWLPDGRLLIASTSRRLIYRLESGGLVLHADLSGIGDVAHPINDMCVDKDGNCFVGEFGLDIYAWLTENLPKVGSDMTQLRSQPAAGAKLFRVSPDGKVQEAASDLRFPNGAAVTRDRKLVVAESLGFCMSLFSINDGKLSDHRRIPCDFLPDGIAQPDAKGRIWVADPFGKSVVLMSADGQWIARVYVPRQVFACAINEEDNNRIYLCTSSTAMISETETRRDSCIEVMDVDLSALV